MKLPCLNCHTLGYKFKIVYDEILGHRLEPINCARCDGKGHIELRKWIKGLFKK